jgi:hypothetical protein
VTDDGADPAEVNKFRDAGVAVEVAEVQGRRSVLPWVSAPQAEKDGKGLLNRNHCLGIYSPYPQPEARTTHRCQLMLTRSKPVSCPGPQPATIHSGQSSEICSMKSWSSLARSAAATANDCRPASRLNSSVRTSGTPI